MTNDYSYLFIERKPATGLKKEFLIHIWHKLYDEYVEEFGWGEQKDKILAIEKDIMIMKLDRIITKDDGLFTKIDILENKIQKLKDKQIGTQEGFYSFKARLEKIVGHQINIQTTSVVEFYSYLKVLDKEPTNGGKKN